MSHQTSASFVASLGFDIDERGHCVAPSQSVSSIAANGISPLSHYGLLAINGPDTAKFLQGQTSCDVSKVNPQLSSSGCLANPKGRTLSSFQLASNSAEQYLLRMRADIVDSTSNILSKYIVFSKAEQHDVSAEYLAVGLYGELANAAICRSFGRCPNGINASLSHEGSLVIQRDQNGQIFECWLKVAQLADLWPQLSECLQLQGSRHWEGLMIQQGLAEITAATVDQFIPQMLNYQLTGAISFTKGCYTGQEIIARMQYKGKLKRRLYRLKLASHDLHPGQDIISADSEQNIGHIVNCSTIDEQHSEALAVITNDKITQACVVIEQQKIPATVLSLSYAITAED
ncbi:MAG: folate-binding protein YgfZ [Oceanicoccus sp.]|jgi:folate-binding protein YgfZ